MTTEYNLFLDVRRRSDIRVSHQTEQRVVAAFEAAGLLGEKRVDEKGRVFNGYDSRCNTQYHGLFDFFLRDIKEFRGKSIRESFKLKMLTDSLFHNTVIEKGLEARAEDSLDALEKADPLARDMPMDMYYQMTFIDSFTINTPVGKQDIHAHLDTGGIIQFWRPLGTNRLYDFDTLKGYLFDMQIDFFNYEGVKKLFYGYKA